MQRMQPSTKKRQGYISWGLTGTVTPVESYLGPVHQYQLSVLEPHVRSEVVWGSEEMQFSEDSWLLLPVTQPRLSPTHANHPGSSQESSVLFLCEPHVLSSFDLFGYSSSLLGENFLFPFEMMPETQLVKFPGVCRCEGKAFVCTLDVRFCWVCIMCAIY